MNNIKKSNILIGVFEYAESGLKKIPLLYIPPDDKKFVHPVFGEFKPKIEDFKNAIKNFNDGVATRFLDGKKVLPLNFDHDSKGDASGWIHSLVLENGTLKAMVEWTEDAIEKIKGKKKMFISAEFNRDWQDENGNKNGFTVVGAALTNIPFLKKGMGSVALTDTDLLIFNQPEEPEMKEQEIRDLLSIDSKVEFSDGLNALVSKMEQDSEKLKEANDKVTELTEEVETLKGQIAEFKEDDEGTFRLTKEEHEEYKETRKKVITLETERAQEKAEIAVNKYIDPKLGNAKFLPKQKEMLVKMYMDDADAFEKFAEGQPKLNQYEQNGSGGQGESYDSPREQVDAEIRKHMKDNKVSYTDAMNHVRSEMPELWESYENEGR